MKLPCFLKRFRKNGFSRYERREVKPLPAVINLLKMFERHPEDLKYFLDKQKSA